MTSGWKEIADKTGRGRADATLSLFSEGFWFTLSFLLFIILGPFATPIVLVVLYLLAKEDTDIKAPEQLSGTL